ncbi:hypothetical protein ACN27G_22865 [Plantactinospora sp. WMMB334]|uniref:hypothetical protein n=1 Tax=Plantactinospora sp. WMMB334 TaxID=3404119 RepID=UPI003B92E16A
MPFSLVRGAALALGIAAFLSRLAVTRWVEPVTDRIEPPELGLLIHVLALVASVVVPLVVFARTVAPPQLRPATFTVDATARRFVAGAFPRSQGVLAIAMLWFAGGLVVLDRWPDREGPGFHDWPSETYHAMLFAVVLGMAVAMPFLRQASIALEPGGIALRGVRGRTTIAWEELAPDGPPAPAPVSPRIILHRRDWHPGPGSPRGTELPVGLLNVQPDFLAAAIREYVAHPRFRAGIGTATELDRLHASLAARPSGGGVETGDTGPRKRS